MRHKLHFFFQDCPRALTLVTVLCTPMSETVSMMTGETIMINRESCTTGNWEAGEACCVDCAWLFLESTSQVDSRRHGGIESIVDREAFP